MLKELVELKVIFSIVLLGNCFTAACSLDLIGQETAFLNLADCYSSFMLFEEGEVWVVVFPLGWWLLVC